jgi:hypothetical protein
VVIRSEQSAPRAEAESLGRAVAEDVLARGAAEILKRAYGRADVTS